jgi:hypothetical protein
MDIPFFVYELQGQARRRPCLMPKLNKMIAQKSRIDRKTVQVELHNAGRWQ